ncbi:Cell division coordinator CpoB [Candidatus Profftia lariciata]|uniref:tol-pal system protein YbgF n=1 Tax=Candidatus Profftia lariciata TaxID=1987921 RepID=UPI001D02139A|nr:tol-pal system protein YbgF [Candidatus Profftia lariciata]UDG81508.1 Cell division coordinator CpoB [Candidatus Profftia lariciata]
MSSNVKRYSVSLWLLSAIAVNPLIAIAQQAPISQSSSSLIEERIILLEHITDAQSKIFLQIQQQLSDNQHDIDILRGQIEENKHALNKVIEYQKNHSLPLDNQKNVNTRITTTHITSYIPTGSDNCNIQKSVSPIIKNNKINNINMDYNYAINLVMQNKKHDQAILCLQNFVNKYPYSIYQPNANYWLGQLLYNKGKKDQSIYYFAIVVKNYPQSLKAPQAMYKIGVILQEKGQTNKANSVYQNIIQQYPTSDAAKQAHKRITTL